MSALLFARKDAITFPPLSQNQHVHVTSAVRDRLPLHRQKKHAEVEEKQLSGAFTGHNVIHVYTRFYWHDRFQEWGWKPYAVSRQRQRLNLPSHPHCIHQHTRVVLSEKTLPITHLYKQCMWMRIAVLYGELNPRLIQIQKNKSSFLCTKLFCSVHDVFCPVGAIQCF